MLSGFLRSGRVTSSSPNIAATDWIVGEIACRAFSDHSCSSSGASRAMSPPGCRPSDFHSSPTRHRDTDRAYISRRVSSQRSTETTAVMRFRLVPRDESFYTMFNEAAQNALVCANELRARMADLPNGTDRADRVVAAERRGDELNRAIRQRLDVVIVTPFDREDIHALSEQLDAAVDNMRAASDLVGLHHVSETIPGVLDM